MKMGIVYFVFMGAVGWLIGLHFSRLRRFMESFEILADSLKNDNENLRLYIKQNNEELKFLSKINLKEKTPNEDVVKKKSTPIKGGNRKGRTDEQRSAAAEKKKLWWANKRKREAEASPKGSHAIPLPYQTSVISSRPNLGNTP